MARVQRLVARPICCATSSSGQKVCEDWELVSEKEGPEDQATMILADSVVLILLLRRLSAQSSSRGVG